MQDEEALRQLASGIVGIIRNSRDVLANKITDIPDVTGAEYAPGAQADSIARPTAYRFVDEIAASDSLGSMRALFEQFRYVEDLLIWGHAPGYTKDNVGQTFLNNYCHALLTGPDGPLKCQSPLGAFVLFGPDTLYRDHWHAPNEVYLAISGDGEWRVDNHSWIKLDAGQTIFIPSQATHAIRTTAEPLLTFSFWLEPGEMEAIVI